MENEQEKLEPTTSPVVGISPPPAPRLADRPIEFSFLDAMKRVIEGKKMRIKTWGPTDYMFRDKGFLRIMIKNKIHDLILTDGDMLSMEWVEYMEEA
jgi:hypothetical protein